MVRQRGGGGGGGGVKQGLRKLFYGRRGGVTE